MIRYGSQDYIKNIHNLASISYISYFEKTRSSNGSILAKLMESQ